MTRFILLFRAVNVGGRALQMAALRDAARGSGFPDLVTYIQSGNLVFSADGDAHAAEAAIERLIETRFDLKAVAIARTAEDFARIAAANPFAEASPKLLHLCLAKRAPASDAPAALAPRAQAGERIVLAGGELWIDYAGGVGNSKLTPAAIDRAAGSPVTARNWNTVQKLIALATE